MYVPNQHSQRPHDVYSISLHIKDGTLRKLYSTKLLAQIRQHFMSLFTIATNLRLRSKGDINHSWL